MKIYQILLIAMLAVIITGCGTPSPVAQTPSSSDKIQLEMASQTPETDLQEESVETTNTPDIQTTPTTSPALTKMIALARSDLSNQLGIENNQIVLVSAIDMIWPDASLGCPQMGISYAQELTPGYLIQLQVNNAIYEYHTNTLDKLVACNRNSGNSFPIIPLTPGEIQDGVPWVPVE